MKAMLSVLPLVLFASISYADVDDSCRPNSYTYSDHKEDIKTKAPAFSCEGEGFTLNIYQSFYQRDAGSYRAAKSDLSRVSKNGTCVIQTIDFKSKKYGTSRALTTSGWGVSLEDLEARSYAASIFEQELSFPFLSVDVEVKKSGMGFGILYKNFPRETGLYSLYYSKENQTKLVFSKYAWTGKNEVELSSDIYNKTSTETFVCKKVNADADFYGVSTHAYYSEINKTSNAEKEAMYGQSKPLP